MATYQLAPGEYLVACPYNMSHQVPNSRVLTHFDKCRRNYKREMTDKGKSVEIVACRFNFVHQYPKIEIDYHHSICPDQHRIVEHIKYHDSELFENMKKANEEKQVSREQSQQNYDEEEEDWDKDCNSYQPAYNPATKLNNEHSILYMPRGLSKSERKAFRKQQTQKHRDATEPTEVNQGPSHMCLAGSISKD